jgi:hypothetical protein
MQIDVNETSGHCRFAGQSGRCSNPFSWSVSKLAGAIGPSQYTTLVIENGRSTRLHTIGQGVFSSSEVIPTGAGDLQQIIVIGLDALADFLEIGRPGRPYLIQKNGNYSPSFAPKGCRFEKRMNPSWSSRKPSLASEVLETPTLWGFVETILNRFNTNTKGNYSCDSSA